MERLYKKLESYGQSDYYPFHMPGHKRQTMGNWNCEAIDITEITGFDNLHHVEGILLEAQLQQESFLLRETLRRFPGLIIFIMQKES